MRTLADPQQLNIIEALRLRVHPKRFEVLQKGLPTQLTARAAKQFIKKLKKEAKEPDKFKQKQRDDLTRIGRIDEN